VPAYKVLSDALWVNHQCAASERAYLECLAALRIDERELERACALVNEGGLVGLWRSNFSRPAPPGQRHYGLAFKHASITPRWATPSMPSMRLKRPKRSGIRS
jgi:hypothetical protein